MGVLKKIKLETMKQFTVLIALLGTASAKCSIKCSAPFVKNKETCTCDCNATCNDEIEILDAAACICNAKTCETACAPGDGGNATEADFTQSAFPECVCAAVSGADPCDAKYGGIFKKADGSDCGAGGNGGDGGTGAAALTAGALVLAATLLVRVRNSMLPSVSSY